MRKDIFLKVIIGIGVWFSVIAIFGVWEHTILEAEMDINRKILAAQEHDIIGGVPGYIFQMFIWTAMILLLGWVWSQLLFPKLILIKKIIFSLIFGIFIMPITIFIPYVAVVVMMIFSTLTGGTPPEFIGGTVGNIAGLFYAGQEQEYEFANVFAVFVVGIVLLLLKTFGGSKADTKIA